MPGVTETPEPVLPCCGAVPTTPYCPVCGSPTGIVSLQDLVAYLCDREASQEAKLTRFAQRQQTAWPHPLGQFEVARKRIEGNLRKWRSWRQALEALLEQGREQ